MRSVKVLMTIGAVGLLLNVAQAADKPAAKVKLSGGSVAAGVGYSWGSGTLTYKGKQYPISVTGLSAGDVGATKIEASGDVFNLKKLDDFDGNYASAAAGATVAGGGSAAAMQNQNGVKVHLVTTTQGVKFTLGAAGVSMKIKR